MALFGLLGGVSLLAWPLIVVSLIAFMFVCVCLCVMFVAFFRFCDYACAFSLRVFVWFVLLACVCF